MTIAEITKGDVKIKIEASPEDIIKIVNGIGSLGNVIVQMNKEQIGTNKIQKTRSSLQLMDLLIDLINNGYFDSYHSLSDIQNKLQDEGKIFDNTRISTYLRRLALVKHKLDRKVIDGKWNYIKHQDIQQTKIENLQ